MALMKIIIIIVITIIILFIRNNQLLQFRGFLRHAITADIWYSIQKTQNILSTY